MIKQLNNSWKLNCVTLLSSKTEEDIKPNKIGTEQNPFFFISKNNKKKLQKCAKNC